VTRSVFAVLAGVAACLVSIAVAAKDYEPGQIWKAKGRAKDPDPKVVILKVERGSPVGDVVFIAVDGVKLCLPNSECGGAFYPLALSVQALDESVVEPIGRTDKLPDFVQGYEFWKDGVKKGIPVTNTVPLSQVLDGIEGGTVREGK
jgi:hypothetical protein